MKAIECRAVIDERHRAVVQLPSDVSPGERQIIVVIDEDEADTRPPVSSSLRDPISAARGMVKGSPVTTRRYFELKREEKELER